MYNKIISRILNKDFLKGDKSFFEYGIFDFESEKVFLDKKHFHKIPNDEFDRRICFIDGGSCELIKSSDIGLFLIRIIGLIFKDNKKQKTIKKEFYVLVSLVEESKKLYYQFETYDKDEKLINDDFLIDIFDKTMSFGGRKVEISQIGGLVRTLSEIQLAANIAKELDKDDIIVLDGNLDIDKTHKAEHLTELYEQVDKKKINLCAISKTCNILTNKARSIIPAIIDLDPKQDTYYYYPTCKSDQAHGITFTKLNKNSDYIFRLDFLKASHLKTIINALAKNSIDFAFPGYPYGLVIADKFARISNKEKEYHLTTFKVKAGDKWQIIKKHINTTNAHDILDSIS